MQYWWRAGQTMPATHDSQAFLSGWFPIKNLISRKGAEAQRKDNCHRGHRAHRVNHHIIKENTQHLSGIQGGLGWIRAMLMRPINVIGFLCVLCALCGKYIFVFLCASAREITALMNKVSPLAAASRLRPHRAAVYLTGFRSAQAQSPSLCPGHVM